MKYMSLNDSHVQQALTSIMKGSRQTRRLPLFALVFFVAIWLIIGRLSKASITSRRSFYPIQSWNSLLHQDDAPPGITEYEELLDHGVLRFQSVTNNAEPTMVWFMVTKDKNSWGTNHSDPPRRFSDFVQQVRNTSLPLDKLTLAILTSSSDEYKEYKRQTKDLGVARRVFYLHPGYNLQGVTRENRHDNEVQKARRGEIAKLRNYLLLKTLQEEKHTIWTDADVMELSPNIIQTMIKHADERDGVGMVTARCEMGGMSNYDLKAWSGTRPGPQGWELKDEKLNEAEQKALGQHHVEELIQGTGDDDLVELKTIGGTILYMRADLVWQGLSFPHQYVIGTRWISDGWDGIETEGLCYRARGLQGGKCWALGGSHHVKHVNS